MEEQALSLSVRARSEFVSVCVLGRVVCPTFVRIQCKSAGTQYVRFHAAAGSDSQPQQFVSFTQFLNADTVRMFFSSLPSHTMSVDSCGRVRQKSLWPLRSSYATSSAWDKQLLSNSIASSHLYSLFIVLGSIVAGLSGVSLNLCLCTLFFRD